MKKETVSFDLTVYQVSCLGDRAMIYPQQGIFEPARVGGKMVTDAAETITGTFVWHNASNGCLCNVNLFYGKKVEEYSTFFVRREDAEAYCVSLLLKQVGALHALIKGIENNLQNISTYDYSEEGARQKFLIYRDWNDALDAFAKDKKLTPTKQRNLETSLLSKGVRNDTYTHFTEYDYKEASPLGRAFLDEYGRDFWVSW